MQNFHSDIRQLFNYIIGYTIYFQFVNIILNSTVWESKLCAQEVSPIC